MFPFLQAAGGGLPRRRLPPHAAGAAGNGLPRRRLPPHAARTRLPPRAAHPARHARPAPSAPPRALSVASPARDPARERERERERERLRARERENRIWGRAVGFIKEEKRCRDESLISPHIILFYFINLKPYMLATSPLPNFNKIITLHFTLPIPRSHLHH